MDDQKYYACVVPWSILTSILKKKNIKEMLVKFPEV